MYAHGLLLVLLGVRQADPGLTLGFHRNASQPLLLRNLRLSISIPKSQVCIFTKSLLNLANAFLSIDGKHIASQNTIKYVVWCWTRILHRVTINDFRKVGQKGLKNEDKVGQNFI